MDRVLFLMMGIAQEALPRPRGVEDGYLPTRAGGTRPDSIGKGSVFGTLRISPFQNQRQTERKRLYLSYQNIQMI